MSELESEPHKNQGLRISAATRPTILSVRFSICLYGLCSCLSQVNFSYVTYYRIASFITCLTSRAVFNRRSSSLGQRSVATCWVFPTAGPAMNQVRSAAVSGQWNWGSIYDALDYKFSIIRLCLRGIISIKLKLSQPIRSWHVTIFGADTLCHTVTLTFKSLILNICSTPLCHVIKVRTKF